MTFEELGLIPPILRALTDYGYEAPSPIQEAAIPPALEGRDVLGCAQTGTGKTCAFATPILQRLQAHPAPKGVRPIRALILTPTRELALQIQENIAAYAKHLPLRSTVIFGGVGQNPQVERLKRGVDILVATPGRLCDLYNQGFLNFSKLETFVLDEADRMLDMGFIHDVRKILGWLPAQKQTLFFSATMPQEITELVSSLLHDPVRVAVDPISSPVEVIDQSVYFVDKVNKTKLLADLFRKDEIQNALVFTRTKHGANKVAGELQRAGIPAAAIHGNKSQTARQQALADFKAGRVAALVATDIAARGLDIEALSHVFNYNMPDVPETYVHRIGRTGRAGHTGVAISFCDYSEKENLRGIERLINKKIRLVSDHPWPMQVFELTRDSHGRVVCAEDMEAKAASREHKRARSMSPNAGHRAHHADASTPSRAGQEKAPRQRPNPLAGERIMDATARLLSSRAPANRDTGRTGAPQARQNGQQGTRKQQRPASGGAARRGRGDQRRSKPELRRSNQKDSTEQPSLMKPYYLNDEK
ncbi:MAG: DEAD/DEAH box helicase [Oscillospiraceae bacterium]|nr:DEAD/DEAH box helicase [Oscillospiraceae bacterium]